ncbi:MAG: acyl carrier protein [Blautia wexlerae]
MNELLEILNELRPDIDFSKENQLVSGGIFDSFDIIALTEEISDTFGVVIKPKQLTAENFDSVDAMMKLIESLK